MDLEGRIDIKLAPGAVSIHSSRPQLAQRLLGGRGPADAAHLAGLVFSLCGKAQQVACEAACAAAAGQVTDAATAQARDLAVHLERAQEHAWRLLLDWPRQAAIPGIETDMQGVQVLRQAAAEARRFGSVLESLLQNSLLGEPAVNWLARDAAAFDAWRSTGGTAIARLFASLGEGADPGTHPCPLLPPVHALDDATVRDFARQALDTPGFCGSPLWRGEPAETGAIARVHKQPLLAAWITRHGCGAGARLLARLLELAELPRHLSSAGMRSHRDGILQGLAGAFGSNGAAGETLKDAVATGDNAIDPLVQAWSLGDNTGAAAVETARGLLLHVVRLESGHNEGKIADYRIVAPTEWNFHPAGPLFQALSGLAAGADLAARARLVAQSLDPCVAYGIEVIEAQ